MSSRCRFAASHHRELHRTGDEIGWWGRFGIDPMPIAYQLWLQTHPIAGPGIPEFSEAGLSVAEHVKDNAAANSANSKDKKPIEPRVQGHDVA